MGQLLTISHTRQVVRDPLAERAAALWPESIDIQRRWMRAVQVVRNTRRGWLLERPVRRVEA